MNCAYVKFIHFYFIYNSSKGAKGQEDLKSHKNSRRTFDELKDWLFAFRLIASNKT